MKTYQDLGNLGGGEQELKAFIQSVVSDHRGSEYYRAAVDAEQYYAKKNVTILKYQKYLYNNLGQKVPDVWSSNYKLTHGIFRQFVIQQVQYVLGNGVSFQRPETKDKLGKDFDNRIQDLAKKAMVDGVSFGFWNYDHLDVFGYADTPKEPGFAPLYDEDSGLLRAGVRYWKPTKETKRWTLYEQDGYTDFIQREGENMEVLSEKRPYMQTIRATRATGIEEVEGRNYPGFPIIPMYANDLKESELIGIRPSIDCYDFIMSGMANNVDETSAFYWTLEGTGAMDDEDLLSFINRMNQLHAVVLDRGQTAEAHTLQVPVEANKVLLDYLKDDMYENFGLMNPSKVLSGNLTATAIRMAYQPQDDKCSDFEYCIRDFISDLMELVGVDDSPTFKWNRIANQQEETTMVLSAANYLDEETLLNHIPWLAPEEVQNILHKADEEIMARFMKKQEAEEAEENAAENEENEEENTKENEGRRPGENGALSGNNINSEAME